MSLRQLQILVWFAKVVGLMPISISYHPIYARHSRRAALQSIVQASIIIPLLTVGLCLFLWMKNVHLQRQSTLLFTTALAWVIGVLRTYCIFIIQVRRRNELVRLFNDALRIRVMFMISYGTMYTDTPFLDRKCRNLVHWKLASLLVQVVFIAMTLYYYEMGNMAHMSVQIAVKFVLLIGTDLVMLVYTTIHFAVVLVALQLFRDCNARLTESVNVVRELLLCRRQSQQEAAAAMVRLQSNITEDIDRIALLYGKVSAYAQRANGLFAVPLVLAMMNSFLYILVAASSCAEL